MHLKMPSKQASDDEATGRFGDITTAVDEIITGSDDIATGFDDITTTFNDITTGFHAITTGSDGTEAGFKDNATGFHDTTGLGNLTTTPHNTNIRITDEHKQVIYFIVSSLTLIFNAVALLVFIRGKQKMGLQPNLHILFVNQSAVDLAAGFFLLTNTLSLRHVPDQFSGAFQGFLCKYWYSGLLLWVTILVSAYNLMVVSIVKYLCVVHPLFNRVHITKNKIYVMIALTYLPAIGFYIALFETASGVKDGKCHQISLWPSQAVERFFGISTYVIVYIIPIIVHIFCYSCILFTVCQRPKHRANTNALKVRSQKFNLRLFMLIALAFFICFTWNLNILLPYYLGHHLDFQGWSYNLSVILLYTNCLVNPIIYFGFYQQYRKYLLQLIAGCFCVDSRRHETTEVTGHIKLNEIKPGTMV